MSLYVIAHKEFNRPEQEGYKIVQVGAYRGHTMENALYDDEGENISEKNLSYCELTGIYWVWKNCRDKYKGIVHYRRYFCRSIRKKNILTKRDVETKLKNYDMIVPFHRNLKMPVRKEYCVVSGFEKDLETVGDVIEEICPEYKSIYDWVLNQKKIYFSNMFIASEKVFDDYCNWLFPILFEVEKRVDLTGYNDYQKRIFGFISERLLIVYIKYNKLKVFEVGVINTEETLPFPRNFLSPLKRAITFFKK